MTETVVENAEIQEIPRLTFEPVKRLDTYIDIPEGKTKFTLYEGEYVENGFACHTIKEKVVTDGSILQKKELEKRARFCFRLVVGLFAAALAAIALGYIWEKFF